MDFLGESAASIIEARRKNSDQSAQVSLLACSLHESCFVILCLATSKGSEILSHYHCCN